MLMRQVISGQPGLQIFVLHGKTLVFLTLPATNNIAGAALGSRLLSSFLGLVELFKHSLELRF